MAMYGDPDALDGLAAQLRTYADDLRRDSADHVAQAQVARWVSVAADACRRRIAEDHASVLAAADDLDEAAAALAEHAHQVRERLAQIAAFERAVRDWFTRALLQAQDTVEQVVNSTGEIIHQVVHRPPIWSEWPVTPYTLPPPGDARWLEVGRFMKQVGAL